MKGRKLTESHKRNIGLGMKGHVVTEITKEKIRFRHKGRIITQEWRDKISKTLKGRPLKEITKIKMKGRGCWNKNKPHLAVRGNKNPNWRGGITEYNKKLRHSLKYKLWHRKVFERDNYTCQDCKKRGGRLHADHVKPFAYYPKLRFEVSNGRTLCKDCHKKTDTYGAKLMHKYYENNRYNW